MTKTPCYFQEYVLNLAYYTLTKQKEKKKQEKVFPAIRNFFPHCLPCDQDF